MIGRISAALARAYLGDEHYAPQFERAASAAIDTMREPTAAMLAAGAIALDGRGSAEEVFRAMMEAAQ